MSAARQLAPSVEATRRTVSFLPEEEKAFGRNAAMLLDWWRFWIQLNKKEGRNFVNGRTWSFSTQEKLADVIGASERTVRRTVKLMVELGLVVTGKFHGDTRNRTNWYAFANEDEALAGSCVRLVGTPWPPHEDTLAASSYREAKTEAGTERAAAPEVLSGKLLPLKLKSDGENMSDATNDRLKAFKAVRGEGSQNGDRGPAAPAREDRRGDLARRQDRDNRAGKPRSPRRGPSAAPGARQPLQCAVWAAWREAMAKAGFPALHAPERRDVQDADRIIMKAGSEEAAIAYVTWVVENWATVLKRLPKIEEYGRSFGILGSRWMESLWPMAAGGGISSGAAIGSAAFVAWMALTDEEKVATDPRKVDGMSGDERIKALEAWGTAKRAVWAKQQESK